MDYTNCNWNRDSYETYRRELEAFSEEGYRQFNQKLVPDIASKMLGVRIPTLKKISRQIVKGDWMAFLSLCQSEYYEEIMVEGLVRAQAKVPYTKHIKLIEEFLPKIDNWAVCDCFCGALNVSKEDKPTFFERLPVYLSSSNPWEQRVGLVIMLGDYLSEEYVDETLRRCDQIHSEHYYVKMAQAWLISTVYAKFPEKGQSYLESQCTLDDWTFKKAIQKTRESYRVNKDCKERLKRLANCCKNKN